MHSYGQRGNGLHHEYAGSHSARLRIHARDDGLSWFKSGWATATRIAYFCGRVLDRKRYEALACRGAKTGYFPRIPRWGVGANVLRSVTESHAAGAYPSGGAGKMARGAPWHPPRVRPHVGELLCHVLEHEASDVSVPFEIE